MQQNSTLCERSRAGAFWASVLTCLALILLAGAPKALALADPTELAQFYGVWIGKSVVVKRFPRTLTARELDIAIWETKSGFEMTWKSLSQREPRRIKAKFVATSGPDHFTAADVDPSLASREKLEARMDDTSLVVTLSDIGNDRGGSLARYRISVTHGQMNFRYTLSRSGVELESVKGSLSKAKVVF